MRGSFLSVFISTLFAVRLDSPNCNFGWKAPSFSLSDPEGKSYNLTVKPESRGLLVAFICNHCPYVHAIMDRFVEDVKKLQESGIDVIAVMSNDYKRFPADSPAQMKRFAKAHDFTFPYVVDESQDVARTYGAVCTPDFFGFNAEGELQYRGRLDDARMDNAKNRTPELLSAMLQVAETGQGPQVQLPSMGCSIKWR